MRRSQWSRVGSHVLVEWDGQQSVGRQSERERVREETKSLFHRWCKLSVEVPLFGQEPLAVLARESRRMPLLARPPVLKYPLQLDLVQSSKLQSDFNNRAAGSEDVGPLTPPSPADPLLTLRFRPQILLSAAISTPSSESCWHSSQDDLHTLYGSARATMQMICNRALYCVVTLRTLRAGGIMIDSQ